MQDKIVFYCWKTRGFKELWKKEHVPRLAICFVTKVWEKLESNGPWLCFQGKLYDWNILTLDCWAVYIFIICFLFCPVVPFEHIQVNISPARSRSFFSYCAMDLEVWGILVVHIRYETCTRMISMQKQVWKLTRIQCETIPTISSQWLVKVAKYLLAIYVIAMLFVTISHIIQHLLSKYIVKF